MHECDWLDALVHAAEHWAAELHDEPDNEDALCCLCKAVKGIHHLNGVIDSKLMDKFRDAKKL